MQPTGNNLLSNLPPMMVSPRVTAPQASPQCRIFGLGPLTGQLPMVQSLLGRPVTSIMPMTPSHPNISSLPSMPDSLPAVVSARFSSVQTPPSITPTTVHLPTEPFPHILLPSTSLRKSAYCRRDLLFVRTKLEEISDGGASSQVDRELAAFLCNPDVKIKSDSKHVMPVFIQACRKNCPMTALALLSKARTNEKGIVETLTSPDIASLGFVLHENVSLPDTPDDGHHNALHLACKHGYADLVKVLITRFGFRYDLPRYDGEMPIDIVIANMPRLGGKRGKMRKILELLRSMSPSVTTPQPPFPLMRVSAPPTGQIPMVQPLVGQPATSIFSTTALHPSIPSVPMMPDSLPAVVNTRFSSVQTPPSITPTTVHLPTEPFPHVMLPSSSSEKKAPRRRNLLFLRTELENISDGGASPRVDRELATFVWNLDVYIADHKQLVVVFAQACRKNCPMTALAMISKTQIFEKGIVETLTSPDIASLGFVLHENVSLPDTPDDGHHNALHLACQYGYPDLAEVLITKFGFRHDLPRYDGAIPIDIVRANMPRAGAHRGRMRRILELLESKSSPVTTPQPHWPLMQASAPPTGPVPMVQPPLGQPITSSMLLTGVLPNFSVKRTVGMTGEEEATTSKKQKTNHVAALTSDVALGMHSMETSQPQDNVPYLSSSHTVAPVTLPLNNGDIPELFEDCFW